MTNTVTAFIGLGSNLATPSQQINGARSAIAATAGIQELTFSSLYQSAPMGPKDQPDYVNAVMAIATELTPTALLHCLQGIENEHGRVRTGERWGPRTLDLDLLLYGDQQIHLPDLIVPHIGIADREFVLYPLYEIAPDLHVPGKGRLSDLVANCPLRGLQRLIQS
ncbi:MAG: 2-amino-4-hydroxy-6-hydroxymethyldihydropteridine diphosphokinase [Methylococcaceae bacterium]|nr:2-amino-4-hydroxy-6-hydroxymethyldihydropteridine diphosphokinase [Methylococcaceae bacterium]MDP3903703.1 2-amino-4-hydroxy-6-hydroxymethyldihydropteridine diphosphokinase [Methylococcaceae bacterium]